MRKNLFVYLFLFANFSFAMMHHVPSIPSRQFYIENGVVDHLLSTDDWGTKLNARNWNSAKFLTAAYHNKTAVVQYILENEAAFPGFEAPNTLGRNALFFAVMNRHRGLVSLLLDFEQRRMDEAMARGEQAMIISYYMPDVDGLTPLHVAVDQQDVSIVQLLLKSIYSGPGELLMRDNNGATPLHYAATRGLTEIGKLLLDTYRDTPGINVLVSLDNFNRSALHYAVAAGHEEFVAMLLNTEWERAKWALSQNRGAPRKPNYASIDVDGNSPLHVAITKNYVSMIKLLVNSEYYFYLIAPDERSVSPLNLAVIHGNIDVVLALLDNIPLCQLLGQDVHGWTSLHYAAKYGRVEIAQLLLKRAIDTADYLPLVAKNVDDESALMTAAKHNQLDFIGMLLTLDPRFARDFIDPSTSKILRGKRKSALHIAADDGNLPLTRMLLASPYRETFMSFDGADNPLWSAIHNGRDKEVKYERHEKSLGFVTALLQSEFRRDFLRKSATGETPFEVGIEKRNLDMLKLFARDVDCAEEFFRPDDEGYTVLHAAIDNEAPEIVEWLLRLPASYLDDQISSRCNGRCSAYESALDLGNEEILEHFNNAFTITTSSDDDSVEKMDIVLEFKHQQ